MPLDAQDRGLERIDESNTKISSLGSKVATGMALDELLEDPAGVGDPGGDSSY